MLKTGDDTYSYLSITQLKQTNNHSNFVCKAQNISNANFRYFECNRKEQDPTEIENILQKSNAELIQNISYYVQSCQDILQLINRDKIKNHNICAQKLFDLSLPVLSLTLKYLIDYGVIMLRSSQYCKSILGSKICTKLMTKIALRYNNVPYHNFSHAFSLNLLLYQSLNSKPTLRHLFSEEQYFYILVSGFAHDLNHKGTNNAYEIKLETNLAKMANNASVLQKMHIRQLWSILNEDDEINFLLFSKKPEEVKKIIVRMILSTDMAFHNTNLEKLKDISKDNLFNAHKNFEDKWILMENLVHGCDIGNACTTFQNYIRWAGLVSIQFHQQTKLEDYHQIEITNFMIFKDITCLYEDQLYFIDKLVYPLWKQLHNICPGLKPMLTQIEENQEKVKAMMNQKK